MESKKKVKTMDELLEAALVPGAEQLYELPPNWEWVRLGNLITLLSGRDITSSKCNNGGIGIPYIMGASNFRNNDLVIERWIEEPTVVGFKGDILLSVKGTVGKMLIQSHEKLHLSRQVMGIRTNYTLNNRYLMYFLKTYIGVLKENAKGLIPGISREDILSIKLPLPPLIEQNRIVEKTERFLNKIEEAKRLIEEAKETFELRRAAILEKAFNGELTSSWRKNNLYYAQKEFEQFHAERKLQVGSKQELKKYSFSNYSIENDLKSNGEFPDNWIELPVGFICECIVPGRDKPKSFSGDIPWITIPDITSETVYTSKSGLGLTEAEIKQVKAKIIPCNSIIMTCVGRFGISSVVQNPVVINQQLHAFLPSKIIDPKFLMYQIRTLEKYMQGIATSTTIAYLNKKNANSLPIKLPPIEEQKEIVIHLEKLLEKEESILKMLPTKNDLDELKQSILSKAFKGELGTKDMNDKPAMELLKSILQKNCNFNQVI
ncbi:restriction endonuclease subunit S [Bacillus toyonensis]|uniref:restriction endonuclease subunit S n=1 Tax=Bacillus toyonensis TaxID=155322 RepID=UPI003802FFF0